LEEAYEWASTNKDPSISTSTTWRTAYVAETTRGRGKDHGQGRGERTGSYAKQLLLHAATPSLVPSLIIFSQTFIGNGTVHW